MTGREEFEKALRRELPPALEGLEDATLRRLAVLGDRERRRRDKELEDSLLGALKELPLPLRPIAKKAVRL